MRRFVTALFFAIMLFSCFFITAFASDNQQKKVVYDRAGVFTESEINGIEAAAKNFYADSYADVYVVTDDSFDAEDYQGDDFRREYGISGDCIVLIITDNGNNNYNIYPYGKCYSKISDSEYNGILDDPRVYSNIKSGNYSEGAIRCIELCEIACRPNVRGYVIGAIITVILITGIFVGYTVYSYKRKMRSEKYPLDRFARLQLNLSRDDFITKFVTVHVIKTNSSGGSRGGSRGGRSGR